MKKILSILLSLLFVLSLLPLSTFANLNSSDISTQTTITANPCLKWKDGEKPKLGDTFTYGSYPQTKVTDTTLISALNQIEAEWISYNYYNEGSISDYMEYKDVEYEREKYRAVTFSKYRPYYTTDSSPTSNDNGYYTNTVYWFKYEPLEWKVLNPETGLCMCTSIIDSQQFYNNDYYGTKTRDGESCYANSYKHSDIRTFLNNTFYNTAFTDTEKSNIASTTISSNDYTKDYSTGNGDVTDKVFLLSYSDITNTTYGFDSNFSTYDTARQFKGTDYAKCQGLYVSTSSSYFGNSYWWLRSAGRTDAYACDVNSNGYVDDHTRQRHWQRRPPRFMHTQSVICNHLPFLRQR